MIEAKHLATYVGPNLYASDPVIVLSLSVSPDDIRDAPRRIPLVVAVSAPWFVWSGGAAPTDTAGVGRFLVAWARAAQNEFGARLNVATVCVGNGETRIVLECHHPRVASEAISLAAKIFAEIGTLSAAEVDTLLQDFWKVCKRYNPDYQAQFLINYARKHDIPYQLFIPNSLYWQFGWGAKSELFYESSPAEDSGMGKSWCRDKALCKQIFASLGAPVAPSVKVKDESQLANAARKIGFPCVTKPGDRGRALGVTTNVRDWEQLVRAYRAAAEHTRAAVMVEAHVEGEVYRLMVMRGKLWRAVRRDRPFVVGDGHSTVRALAEALHAEGLKGFRPGRYWKPAPLDESFRSALRGQNVSPDDVPPKGSRIRLHNIPLLSLGAVYIDVTAAAHPDVRLMSETIARAFGMQVCGLDYITADISKSCFGHGVFLEVNPTPGLRIPWEAGVDADEVGRMVLGDKPGRIPLILIIAPGIEHARIGTTIPRDDRIAWICGQRAGIGSMEFPDRQSSFHQHLARIIKNKVVEAVVVVCELDQIAAQGMPAKRAHLTVFIESGARLPAWATVLKEHSERTVETSAIEQLPELIASALAERPMQSPCLANEPLRHQRS